METLGKNDRLKYDAGTFVAYFSVDGKTFSHTSFRNGTLGLLFLPTLFDLSVCHSPSLLVPTCFMEKQEDDSEALKLAKHHEPSFQLLNTDGVTIELWNYPIDVNVKLEIRLMGDWKWMYKVMAVVAWNHKFGILVGIVLVTVIDGKLHFEAHDRVTLLLFWNDTFLFDHQYINLSKNQRKKLPNQFNTFLTYEIAVRQIVAVEMNTKLSYLSHS